MVQETQSKKMGSEGRNLGPMVAGGLMMLYGLSKRSLGGGLLGAAGAGLLYYGATGRSPAQTISEVAGKSSAKEGVSVHRAVTINRSPREVYDFWRQLENLPRFMQHLESVEQLDERRSRWQARLLGGMPLTWEARITRDEPGEVLAWETVPGSEIEHFGHVRFQPAGADEGTELYVEMSYRPPMGVAGEAVARLLNTITEQQIKEDIRRCKHILETGEVPTIEGQSSGRKS
jgi:uncharacterized membrane protein